MLATYEVRCGECGELRWPRLPERPAAYVCVRCNMVEPAKRIQRRDKAKRSAATRKSRSAEGGDRA